MFLGYTSILGGKNSFDPTVTSIETINSITLSNEMVDDLYVTKNTDSLVSPISKIWDFDTILHASFQGNLLAGNIDFTLSQCSSIRIKMREKGTYKWMTIFDISISTASDLTFERFERFCKGGKTEYEIALVPVINGIEGNYSVNTVISDFDGIVLSEKDTTFLTPLDAKCTRQRNRTSSILNSIDGKFPTVIINSQNCYDSGTASGVFIQLNEETCDFDVENGWKYRDDFLDFLSDGKPKFLKTYDNKAYIVSIVDNPSENNDEHYQKVTTSFSWIQIGSVDDVQTYYDMGLSDINSESL